jgi:hypothetical protein
MLFSASQDIEEIHHLFLYRDLTRSLFVDLPSVPV